MDIIIIIITNLYVRVTIEYSTGHHAAPNATNDTVSREMITYISEKCITVSPQDLYLDILTMYPNIMGTLTQAQVYYWWNKSFEIQYKLHRNQFTSTEMHLDRAAPRGVEKIFGHTRQQYSTLGFTMPLFRIICEIAEIEEFHVDSTYKTNRTGHEHETTNFDPRSIAWISSKEFIKLCLSSIVNLISPGSVEFIKSILTSEQMKVLNGFSVSEPFGLSDECIELFDELINERTILEPESILENIYKNQTPPSTADRIAAETLVGRAVGGVFENNDWLSASHIASLITERFNVSTVTPREIPRNDFVNLLQGNMTPIQIDTFLEHYIGFFTATPTPDQSLSSTQ
ncbi:hypothetical protein INT45_007154 [Circinella minor]|uniref:Uncharacterized protein n=1 Tax=Circinella minor TaxID=1195481 RepID=A0A8H7S429_9FUNG|nr:hypothetical protein INT45_007154 [Circinella minor]